MTYSELLKHLQSLPKDRLNDTATVFCQFTDEYLPVKAMWSAGSENDVLDEDHPYFVVEI
jgi:hypothetical protein